MTKMLHCPSCLKSTPQGRASHEWDAEDWNAEPLVWGWRCENCGYFKKPRRKRVTVDYDYVTKHALNDAKLSLRNTVLFHYFNPNGLIARKRLMDKRVDRAIEDTGCPNGVLFVHGGLSTFHYDQLYKLVDKKTPGRIEVMVCLNSLERKLKEAEAWLVEIYAKHGKEMPPAESFSL